MDWQILYVHNIIPTPNVGQKLLVFVGDEGKKETKQCKEVLAKHAYAGRSPTAVKFQQRSSVRPAYRLQQ